MSEQEYIDLDEEVDEEAEEAESLYSADGFMDKMENSFNEGVLSDQGLTQVGSKFRFTGLDGIEYDLSFKQKLFAEGYLKHKGNGVDAVIYAGYDVRKKYQGGNPINNVFNRKLAKVIASENLTKPNLMAYIQTLYERYGFTDEAVEREHLFLINQQADLKTKAKAIDMFYNLKSRYPAKKMDLTSLGEAIVGVTYVNPTTSKQEPDAGQAKGDTDSSQA